jgi:hypothetical protein
MRQRERPRAFDEAGSRMMEKPSKTAPPTLTRSSPWDQPLRPQPGLRSAATACGSDSDQKPRGPALPRS